MTTKINDSVHQIHGSDAGEWDYELLLFHGLCFSEYEDAYRTTWELERSSGWWFDDLITQKTRVLSISYDSCAKRLDKTGRVDFNSIGRILVQDIVHLAKVGQTGSPVILIGYCLGGLVIRKLCVEAERQFNEAQDGSSKGRLDRFLTNVRGIGYLDTPLGGSSLRDHLKSRKRLLGKDNYNGPVLKYLKRSSKRLMKLNGDFYMRVLEREWKQHAVRAVNSTLKWGNIEWPAGGIQVVEEESARQCGEEMVNVGGDHFTVLNAHDTLVKDHIRKLIQGVLTDQKPRSPTGDGVSVLQDDQINGEMGNVEEQASGSDNVTNQLGKVQTGSFPSKKIEDHLHELYKPAEIEMELYFFPGLQRHGDLGNGKENVYSESTWMLGDNHCWLGTWLPEAFPKAHILAVSYANPESFTTVEKVVEFLSRKQEGFDMHLLTENLRRTVNKVHFPGRRMVLVGHCVGGLVIKNLIEKSACSASEDFSIEKSAFSASEDFSIDIHGVAYFATPHAGYVERIITPWWWTNIIQWFSGKASNPQGDHHGFMVQAARMNIEHDRLKATLGWKELALIATRPTQQGTMIVDEASASHGIHRSSVIPVAADHFTICKPNSRESNSFQYLVHFIRTAMDEAQYPNMNVRRKKARGIAMIIAMEEGRLGSVNDRNRLEVLLPILGFDTFPVCGGASKILKNIEEILENDVNEQDESFLCIVNAHGGVSPQTQGAEGEELSAVQGVHFIFHLVNDQPEELLPVVSGILEPIAACEKLVGKPKVIVINACRTELGPEILVKYNEKRGGGNPIECDPVSFGRDDCLLMYSAQLNAKSWRLLTGIQSGTLCLLEMVRQLIREYRTRDVQEIFESVGTEVEARAKALQEELEKDKIKKKKKLEENQLSQLTSQLKVDKEKEIKELGEQIQKLQDQIKDLNRDGQRPVIDNKLKKRLSWRP